MSELGRLTVEDWEIWIAVCTRVNNPDLGYSSIEADRRDYAIMHNARLHPMTGAVYMPQLVDFRIGRGGPGWFS